MFNVKVLFSTGASLNISLITKEEPSHCERKVPLSALFKGKRLFKRKMTILVIVFKKRVLWL